jgi:hypothetical protein
MSITVRGIISYEVRPVKGPNGRRPDGLNVEDDTNHPYHDWRILVRQNDLIDGVHLVGVEHEWQGGEAAH